MVVTLIGISIDERDVHLSKTLSPIVVTLIWNLNRCEGFAIDKGTAANGRDAIWNHNRFEGIFFG
jgi:hypothetical protein